MSCLDQITDLKQKQEKTLELYKELYDSFVAPRTSEFESFLNNESYSGMENKTFDISKYSARNYQDVPTMIEDSRQTLDSTCDISRLKSQNTTISEMWNNFSVDKYAPREKKQTKAMSAPPVKKTRPRMRITVPDPFYMTLRDELKKPTKTKAQEEVEQKRIQKQLEDEAECKKQFKASPIPASTFQSRLKHIEEKQEARRQRVKAESKALTKALQKPFSFDQRHKLRRSRSLSALDTDAKKRKEDNVKFHARPMPHHIFDPVVSEKAKEEEAYRQVRIKMRAEQLLAESDLPPTMKRHGIHYTDGKIRRIIREENEARAHLTEEHTFTPAIKDFVPDYALLHKQQEAAILERQTAKPTTIIEPFNLRTEQLAQYRAQHPKTPPPAQHHKMSPTLSKSPCLYTGIYSEVVQTRPTVSSSLRDSATRTKLLEEKKKAQLEYEQDLTRQMKQLEIRKSIAEKSKALDPTLTTKHITQQKLREKLAEQKQRELEWKEKLDEMKGRLKDRPFLFERAAMETARLSADKTFRKALMDAGLDDTLIRDMANFEEDSLMQ